MTRSAPILLLLLFAPPVVAQSSGPAARLRGETEAANTRKRLAEAQQKLAAGKATEAADDLQRILDESGDDLVLVQNNHFQPARRLVQQSFAALPPETLKAFQNRLEEPAKKLLDAGRRDRDPAPLRQLLGRYFISRPAEEGILLLGELLFERGEFRAAEQTWRWLLPAADAGELSYPNPKTDPALAKAKLLLAEIFAGDLDRAKADLALFSKEHPKAVGHLAGQDGTFAETLAKLLAAPPVPRVGRGPSGWTTFAGNPSRDGLVSEPMPKIRASEPTWCTALPRGPGEKPGRRPASFPAAKTLAFHPVVLDGRAYIAEAGRIVSFDLKTGESRIAFDLRALEDAPSLGEGETALPNLLDADFTLTAHAGKLYARLGNVALPNGTDIPGGRTSASFIVVLQPLNPAALPKTAPTLKATATLAPPTGKPGKVAWEGSPLVADGKLFAAFTRLDERGRGIHAVACYDDPPGAKPNWVADIADTDASLPRHRHEVLTLAGSNVVLALPQGLIAALDRGTGKLAWAFRAPAAERPPPNGSQQDLCPAVFSSGRLFFAPAEGDKLYALDADSGRPAWEAGPMQVEQILGVARNRVVVTISAPHKGIRAYDTATGSAEEPRGWKNHDDRDLATYGRGLLTEDSVLWPTKQNLNTLSLLDGSMRVQPQGQPHGNLAYADGVLLVATPTELWGYVLDPQQSAPPTRPQTLVQTENVPPYRSAARKPSASEPWEWPRADLAFGAARELPPGSWPLQLADGDASTVLVCDGATLWGWPVDLSKPLWKAALKVPARLLRAAFDDGHWIAWGGSAVVSVKAADGAIRWRFDTPTSEASLEGGALVGSRFVACLGPRCVLALDTGTGAVAWLRDPLGRSRFREFATAGTPTFSPHFLAAGDVVLIQKSDGERWTLSADTGRVLHTAPTCLTPWTMPPALTGGGSALIPDGAGRIAAVDLRSNRQLWQFDAEGETSLTGAAPEVRAFGADFYALIARNYGPELVRLDAKTGDAKSTVRVPGHRATLADAVADAGRIYLPYPGGIASWPRTGGGKFWTRGLASGVHWQATVTDRGPLLWTREPIPEEPLADVLPRLFRRFAEWPAPERVPGFAITLMQALFTGTATVLQLDSGTGDETARAEAPVLGPTLQLRRSGFGAVLLGIGAARPLSVEN